MLFNVDTKRGMESLFEREICYFGFHPKTKLRRLYAELVSEIKKRIEEAATNSPIKDTYEQLALDVECALQREYAIFEKESIDEIFTLPEEFVEKIAKRARRPSTANPEISVLLHRIAGEHGRLFEKHAEREGLKRKLRSMKEQARMLDIYIKNRESIEQISENMKQIEREFAKAKSVYMSEDTEENSEDRWKTLIKNKFYLNEKRKLIEIAAPEEIASIAARVREERRS